MKDNININKENTPIPDKTQSTFTDDKLINRANEVRRDDDNINNISIILHDVDLAVFDFLKNKVKPYVIQNDQIIQVPVIYSNQESWKSIRATNYYKSGDSKIEPPLISFYRSSVEVDSAYKHLKIATDHDSGNRMYFEKKYSKRNAYDRFSLLENSVPQRELYSTPVPDYVKVNYDINILTNYMSHMNKIQEHMIYKSGVAAGEKYKFSINIDSFANDNASESTDDRNFTSTSNIVVSAYILPEDAGREIITKKSFSASKLIWGTETSDHI